MERAQTVRAHTPQPSTAGTVNVFRVFGVPVKLHFTFILFAIFAAVSVLSSSPTHASYTVFIGGSLISVLLHELGHAAMASRFGVRTVEIVMFPIGGLSRMESALLPWQEILVASAGPLVNLLLAGALFAYMTASHQVSQIVISDLVQPSGKSALALLLYGNVLLAAFNLLPAYPMDGGRIMRALLCYIWPDEKATRMAAWMGRMLAMGMGLYGLLAPHFMLVFFALFIYLGAAQESVAVLGRILSQGTATRAIMVTEFRTLQHSSTLREAADLMFSTLQQDFPVLHGGQVVGLLGPQAIARGMATEGPDAYVAGAMDRDLLVLDPADDLATILPLMAHAGRCALIMQDSKLLGLLPTAHVSEFLTLRRIGLEPANL